MDDLEKVRNIISYSNNIVFFGGAGMSTESGIPDFRSSNGIYSEEYDSYPPEYILSNTFFKTHPDIFYKFFREKSLEYMLDAEPNKGHEWLAEMEKKGKLKAVITQNIDGLHQRAGSKKVLELHGSMHENYCMDCHKIFDLDYLVESDEIAKCDECGGIIHPGAVLFEERLDTQTMNEAICYISHCDVLIIAGTSLNVFPAAGLIDYYQGDNLILIDKNPNVTSSRARFVLHGKAGEILSQL